jgi:hypothetical protein
MNKEAQDVQRRFAKAIRHFERDQAIRSELQERLVEMERFLRGRVKAVNAFVRSKRREGRNPI